MQCSCIFSSQCIKKRSWKLYLKNELPIQWITLSSLALQWSESQGHNFDTHNMCRKWLKILCWIITSSKYMYCTERTFLALYDVENRIVKSYIICVVDWYRISIHHHAATLQRWKIFDPPPPSVCELWCTSQTSIS